MRFCFQDTCAKEPPRAILPSNKKDSSPFLTVCSKATKLGPEALTTNTSAPLETKALPSDLHPSLEGGAVSSASVVTPPYTPSPNAAANSACVNANQSIESTTNCPTNNHIAISSNYLVSLACLGTWFCFFLSLAGGRGAHSVARGI